MRNVRAEKPRTAGEVVLTTSSPRRGPARRRSALGAAVAGLAALPVLVGVVLPVLADDQGTLERTEGTPVFTALVSSASDLASAAAERASTSLSTTTTTAAPTTTTTTAPPTTSTTSTTLPAPTLPPPPLPPPTEPPPPPPPPPAPAAPGIPPDSYWDRMAMCETAGNWAHFPNGTWTGGLGIYNQTWLSWGGGEFAPKAGQATRAQQIIVANRIAVTGHNGLGPVGFTAWGCYSKVGPP